MRLALVCDWLTTTGGAEKVLLELHRLYPDAPIYTSQYSKKGINWFDDADVRTGWLQIFPKSLRKILGPLRQLYFSHLDLTDYDVVISVTGAEAKSVKTKSSPRHNPISSLYHRIRKKSIETPQKSAYHLSYCHVPTQYYWQFYDQYLKDPGFGPLNFLIRPLFKILVKPLRRSDYQAAQRVDQFITISSYSAAQIQQYYQRDSIIIAPPVDVKTFRPSRFPTKKSPNFIISCRQVTWKRVDLAISACLELGVPLKVIGSGSEHDNLVKLAQGSPLITFIDWLDAKSLARELQTSSAYLFPSVEPFGIAPVEALAAGCPVIAYRAGASQDFITKSNGLFFDQQTPASLAAALQKFSQLHFDPRQVSDSVSQFSTQTFDQKISALVQDVLQKHQNSSPAILQHNIKNNQTGKKKHHAR